MTLRRRLLLTSLLLLAVGLSSVLTVANVLLARRTQVEVSTQLRARADAQSALVERRGSRVVLRELINDETLDRQAWLYVDGRAVERPTGVSAPLDHLAGTLAGVPRPQERAVPGQLRLRAQPVPGLGRRAVVIVGASTKSVEDLRRSVAVGSAVTALVLLLAGGLAVRRAVDGALGTVAEMTVRARRWQTDELEHRFALGPARDEISGLAAVLDGMLERIAAARRREQRLSSEVAHELRTPVAALRARAELALATGPEGDPDRVRALEVAVEQAVRLQTAIDTLMAAARQEHQPTAGVVDLRALLAQSDVPLEAAPVPLLAEGEPEIVRRTLAPLLDNARRHARSRVWARAARRDGWVELAVCDDGPGFGAGLLEEAFAPGVQGDGHGDGAGLGLALARRLARSCGGEVTAEPGPGGRVILRLPAPDSTSA